MNDQKLLDMLQKDTFAYFTHECNPENGLILDKTAAGSAASVAVVGLALSAYPVAVERGLMARGEALKTTLKTLRFFRDSVQGTAADATGFKGFYYHFLDMAHGKRANACELSTIDTSMLVIGALAASEYYTGDTPDERELREAATEIYRRVDWNWARNDGLALTHGWKPESGFLRHQWQGYDEALFMYILALGSPVHRIPPESYAKWCETYEWRKIYGHEVLYSGPLFTHQISHIWIDFRNIRDDQMREKDSDYFENSKRATYIQQHYSIENPHGFKAYGPTCWGITASDGPGPGWRVVDGWPRKFYGYTARGVPDGPDDGSIAPWAVAASLPFAPEIVLPTIDHFVNGVKLTESNPYGFKATFNPTYERSPGKSYGWVSPSHFGLNQGPIVLMIENYRSELVWNLVKSCINIPDGLRRAGFTGGWLENESAAAAE